MQSFEKSSPWPIEKWENIKPSSLAAYKRFQAMAKPVAGHGHAVVLKSAWGIDHGIDFLVLVMAFF